MKRVGLALGPMVATVVGVVLSPMTGPVVAQPYDDPAVAICEAVALHDQSQNPSYKRLSGEIYGLTASIIYEMSVLNLAPTTQLVECNYRKSEGSYVLDFASSADERACQDLSADQILQSQPPERLGEAVIAAAWCENLKSAVAGRALAVEQWLKLARDAGAYPIAPTATNLRSKK